MSSEYTSDIYIEKIKKTIHSCTTPEQLKVATRAVNSWLNNCLQKSTNHLIISEYKGYFYACLEFKLNEIKKSHKT